MTFDSVRCPSPARAEKPPLSSPRPARTRSAREPANLLLSSRSPAHSGQSQPARRSLPNPGRLPVSAFQCRLPPPPTPSRARGTFLILLQPSSLAKDRPRSRLVQVGASLELGRSYASTCSVSVHRSRRLSRRFPSRSAQNQDPSQAGARLTCADCVVRGPPSPLRRSPSSAWSALHLRSRRARCSNESVNPPMYLSYARAGADLAACGLDVKQDSICLAGPGDSGTRPWRAHSSTCPPSLDRTTPPCLTIPPLRRLARARSGDGLLGRLASPLRRPSPVRNTRRPLVAPPRTCALELLRPIRAARDLGPCWLRARTRSLGDVLAR